MKEIIDRLDRIIDILTTAKEEREIFPPNTPYKEKGEACVYNPARTREEKLVCRGMRIPKLDEVKAFAATNGIDADTAEDFWLNCEATGWRYKGSAILNWRSMIRSWARSRKRNADLEAARTAHIDAKMDERERRRERRASSFARKPADNYIKPTEADLEEVRRDYDF